MNCRARTHRLPAAAAAAAALVALAPLAPAPASAPAAGSYEALIALFAEWRDLERPPLRDGAPDYTAGRLARTRDVLAALGERLAAIDPSAWPLEQQVDYQLLRAEMNGLDFDLRVLRPWGRDPAFYQSVWTYQSDTPSHEGPTHHALVELWTYEFPLAPEDREKLAGELRTIPPLLEQARGNLTGNARELWKAGIGNLRDQAAELERLGEITSGSDAELATAIADARLATVAFVDWLERQAPTKTGPSGVGRDNYTWYLRNVHLVPLTWEDEVRLLERELDRAHASLALEEHRNRELPALTAISSPEEYERRALAAVAKYVDFLEQKKILTVEPYMAPALAERIGSYVAPEDRNFFHTAIHYEPMTLWTHFHHWFDLARMRERPHPSPIRRGPLLSNIFDSRAEGLATGMEEMMMHAGLYDDNPRVREIVWIMLAQRAARGLGSLWVHANEWTMKQARDFHVAWTPRGWMREDLDLLGFEQQLYLRQPGYGTSYVTGKYLIEQLLAERRRQVGDGFTLAGFFDELDTAGIIPVSLIRWQLTGKDDQIRALVADPAGVAAKRPRDPAR